MRTSIYEDLLLCSLVSPQTTELFAEGTRDRHNIPVFRDSTSGVIYIRDFYIGDEVYIFGG